MSILDNNRYPAESLLHDAEDRKSKAAKILAILRDAVGPGLASQHSVEVGCAAGLITCELAPHVASIVGLEYDPWHVQHMGYNDQPNLLLIRGDAHNLPFADASLDLVVCAQVYEHVADAHRMVQEIRRVLRPGGVCFFSGPNRLDPIEHHYGLPFVSWLPHSVADAYLRLAGYPAGYAEHPMTYWGLCRLWQGFAMDDYTVKLILEPERFGIRGSRAISLARRAPRWLLEALMPFYPNYNWVLTRTGD